MKVTKIYEAPEVEVLMMQAECMCTESEQTIPVGNTVITDDLVGEGGVERAIKGQDLFDINDVIGLPEF